MKTGLLALTLLLSATAGAQTRVSNYAPGQNEEGITYFLPTTALRITVEAEKTTFTPGDFCRYAEKYLRLADVSSKASELWKIKSIKVVPVGQPNQSQAYTIELKDKTVAPLVELTNDGIIKAINTSAPKTVSADYILEKSQPSEDGSKYMTEEILSAGSTAKMAELTAKEIYNIRESKNLILRGQADTMPKDGASLKLIMDNLDKQEKALTEMFTGKKVTEDKLFTAVITPENNITEGTVLRFSKKLGILSSDNLAGEPIYIKVESLSPMQITAQSEDNDKKKKKKKAPKGILYNIPGKGSVTITFKGESIFEDNNLMFAQFGNTELLVDDLFNKKVNTRVIFDTVTGGIKKIDKD